jgi:hypothetical protein
MDQKDKPTPDAGEVQVFELTMDNPEDQDELNRRLRKPGEAGYLPAAGIGKPAERKSPEKSPKSNAQ